jgi:hypothetical protein
MPSILETTDDLREKEVDPKLLLQVKNGANWFYWIGGLSLINSVIYAYGGDISFIAGLGITQLVDVVFNESLELGLSLSTRLIAMTVNLIFVIAFALIGYYAGKAFSGAFIVGIVIYTLDMILLVFLDSLFAVLFHIFALVMIVVGFLACRKVNKVTSGVPL